MKNIIKTTALFVAMAFTACTGNAQRSNTTAPTLSREQIKTRSFDQLFKAIDVKAIPEDVFTLVGEDFSILTAGTPTHYNSMVASWGGWGVLFNKPQAFSFLRSSRYTLELIRKEGTYTMTFFDVEFKDDIMKFGQASGRSSDKMKETALTSVQTPNGNMAFKEAKLIIELKLTQVTTVSPDDFLVPDSRKFVVDANPDGNPNAYHKIVFGEITNVWVRK
jgi:flavin reductase (DIM6/NTAB) family NADH-FMN oxidoreductase RutF